MDSEEILATVPEEAGDVKIHDVFSSRKLRALFLLS